MPFLIPSSILVLILYFGAADLFSLINSLLNFKSLTFKLSCETRF